MGSGGGTVELVLIPWPVMGHVQIAEFANLIIHRQFLLPPGATLSVTVLLMKLPNYIDTLSGSFIDSICASSSGNAATPHLRFLQLPPTDPSPKWSSKTRGYFIHNLVLSQRSNVANFLRSNRPNIAAVVTDMLCTSMIDVAHEFGLPAYVFCTSPANFLGAMLHCQSLHDEKNQVVAELQNADSDVWIPSCSKPVPPQVLPLVIVDKQFWLDRFLYYARDYRKAKGIIINTFTELEPVALDSFLLDSAYGGGKVPPIYPIGPMINHGPSPDPNRGPSEALKWLDSQPPESVVFLCFGSQGSLNEDQIHELAIGLEKSAIRFLWSLRKQSPDNQKARFPSEYDSYREVLPEGFLERTSEIGKVVGWVPQLDVLAHPAVGGFVSHCGWNSVLESLWHGIPLATWPLHAEQQMNAFLVARELGLAMEFILAYHERNEGGAALVTSGQIERGIRELMLGGSELRKRVREMKEKSRMSMAEGGASYLSFKALLDHIVANVRYDEQD